MQSGRFTRHAVLIKIQILQIDNHQMIYVILVVKFELLEERSWFYHLPLTKLLNA